MAWNETCELKEKILFIAAWLKNEHTMVDLCKQFNISRKTGYKIIARYDEDDSACLKRHSRAHHNHPETTRNHITQILLKTKKRYPKWGPRKIKDWLEIEYPNRCWPAASTIGEIFKRNGLVKPKKRKCRSPLYSQPFLECTAPNIVWSADYKGQFRLGGNGRHCYPLTISDNYSRFLLGCKALYSTHMEDAKKYFEKVFREYGLPIAIKTDNGKPFASASLGGLTQLSVWWVKLGIIPERIKPGHPEQNGRHERMHRTLKEATAKPPYLTIDRQQLAFNRFINEYNFERPHDALNKQRPAEVYFYSERKFPRKIPSIEYPSTYLVRKVRHGGDITWKGKNIFISESLRGEHVGLIEIDDGIWEVYFSMMKLADLDYKKGKILHPS
jgi:transposase InsO family protein